MGTDRVGAVRAGGRTLGRWAGSLRAGVAAVTVAVAVVATGATAGAVSGSPVAITTVGRLAAGSEQCVDVYALAVQGTGQSSVGADRFSDTGFLSGLFGTVNQQLSGAVPLGGSVSQARVTGESVFDAHRRAEKQAGSASAGGVVMLILSMGRKSSLSVVAGRSLMRVREPGLPWSVTARVRMLLIRQPR